jgi:hydroxymethylglutaryl-CoA synthase
MSISAGVSDIVFSVSRLYLPLANRDNPDEPTEFSLDRKDEEGNATDPKKYLYGLGVAKMSIPDTYQDPVSLAANAIYELIERNDIKPQDINRIEIGTETSPDKAKSITTYVIGALEKKLGERSLKRCAAPEGKAACAPTAFALENALDWVWAGRSNGKYRIVGATDIARYGLGTGAEYTQGAAAVAVLVEKDPQLLESDKIIGQYTEDEGSFWRPNDSRVAFVKGKDSEAKYLNAMREAFDHYKEQVIETGFIDLKLQDALTDYFDLISFHQPFPKMVQRGFSSLLIHEYRNLPRWKSIIEEIGEEPKIEDFDSDEKYEAEDKNFRKRFERTETFKKPFKEKVADGQEFGIESGNSYSVSVWGHLASLFVLKDRKGEDLTGKKGAIGFFGSGCNASGQSYTVLDGYKDVVRSFNLIQKLEDRIPLSLKDYEALHEEKPLSEDREYILSPENEFVLTEVKNGYRYYDFVE